MCIPWKIQEKAVPLLSEIGGVTRDRQLEV